DASRAGGAGWRARAARRVFDRCAGGQGLARQRFVHRRCGGRAAACQPGSAGRAEGVTPMTDTVVLAVLYEHPDWVRPLLQELERCGVPYQRVFAGEHRFEPSAPLPADHPRLVFNRMSPSAWKRGRGSAINYTVSYLQHLEAAGVRVWNGSRTFAYEI